MGLSPKAIEAVIKIGEKVADELPSIKRAFPAARKAATNFINGIEKKEAPKVRVNAPADDAALKDAQRFTQDQSFKTKPLADRVKVANDLHLSNFGLIVDHLEDISPSRIFKLAAIDGNLLREIHVKFDPRVLEEMVRERNSAPTFGSKAEYKFISQLTNLSEGRATLNIKPNNTISLDFGGYALSASRVGRTFVFDSIKWAVPQAR